MNGLMPAELYTALDITCGQGFTYAAKNVKIVIVSNFLIGRGFVNEIDL
ncbi:hypothetical protein [Paenibacillus sp. FSL R7-0331]|nr:hypothetical protein [Paenibacillus sp. FSL R7-0331]